MTPRETDCIKLASLTGMFAKIINVVCFNTMVIVGEMRSSREEMQNDPVNAAFPGTIWWYYATGFNNFYASMMDTPFFGEWYSVISPLFIDFFAALSLAFGLYKYNSKALDALALYSAKTENLGDAAPSRIEK